MNRRNLLSTTAGALALYALRAGAATPLPQVEVFKNPSCGCCGAWVEHMRAAGFRVKVTPVADTAAVRRRLGMPDLHASCHTATVGDYVVEGHVPASDVVRLLTERPAALGLAVPGMPAGAPGMEAGARRAPYQVLLVPRNGQAVVFARYPGTGIL